MSQIRLEQLGSCIGAIISGLDLRHLDETQVDFVTNALNQHIVVFFRDQQLEPKTLQALAEKFGTPTPYPFVRGIKNFPEIVEVKKLPEETINFGGVWHSDTTYLDTPAMGALLYGADIPSSGGDTLFANMYAVYESLSMGMQKFLGNLNAINSADKQEIAATRPGQPKKGLIAEHPVVRRHPVTNKPLLYVNRAHTIGFVGMSPSESAPILDYLFQKIERPEFACRFVWQAGSLAFWDNRACQHYPVNDYHGQLRRMLRVSLQGDKPF